jgi:hypothetical protein
MTLREKQHNAIILCMDHAFMPNRAKGVWNAGWSTPDKECGLNGWGEHPVIEDSGLRLRKHKWDRFLNPKRAEADKDLLFCGQVFGDAQIRGKVKDYAEWCRETIAELGSRGFRTSFRPHPVMINRGTVAQYGNVGRTSTQKSLDDAFDANTYCAGFNSNAVTQAFMAGLHCTVYNEGSMLWPCVGQPGRWASWDLREKWMQMMAYTQWTTEELEDGTWLEYNRPIMERLIQGDESRPWHTVDISNSVRTSHE